MTARLATFVIAGLGVALFHWLDLPLPWLLGPIFACLLAALAGAPLKGVKVLNEGMRTILGVAVGATLTPAVLFSLPSMWQTLLLIPFLIAATGLLGIPYFQRLWGYDFPTAYYSTMPGGLQDMLAFGEEAGGNVRTLSLVHATRVLVIVSALPFLLVEIWQADLSNPPGVPIDTLMPRELIIMVLCALIGWRVGKAVGLFGASIL
ncbi:MAG: AbrB family transcriptional regulator, partial [Pseudomonadota bacterium]